MTIFIHNIYSQAAIKFKGWQVIAVMAVVAILIMEVKHTYGIDIIPSVDFPFDNAYFYLKGRIGLA